MNKITDNQVFKINLIAVLEDLQEQLMVELHPDMRQAMKQMLGETMKHTRRFVRSMKDILPEEQCNNFGIAADMIRELIEKEFNQ